MIEITGEAQKTAWADRTFPGVERLGDLVWSIPIDCSPLPVRYTFSYLLANADGEFVVVDPGSHSTTGHDQLLAGIRGAGLDPSRMRGVVVTHFHPDHLGAADGLIGDSGAWLGLHRLEMGVFAASSSGDDLTERDRHFLDLCGVPSNVQTSISVSGDFLNQLLTGEHEPRRLEDGDLLDLPGRTVRVVLTPGHTAGHICLVDEDSHLVLTGDHVLPRITPNIGVAAHEPDRDAVAEYYDSLKRIAAWDSFEVCPAHEYRFRGLAERSRQLTEHHEERSAEVGQILAEHPSSTTWDVARQLTWSRGWASLDGSNLRSAIAETRSHINHLKALRQAAADGSPA